MIIALLLLGVFILLLYHYSVQYGRFGRFINQLPGMPTRPIIGNTLEFLISPEKLWKLNRHLSEIYYPIHRMWFFTSGQVSIRHPNDLEAILGNMTQHLAKGELYDPLVPWLKTGLLTSTGQKWQRRRKILTPAFHFSILKQYIDVLIDEGNRMVNDILTKIKDSTVTDLMSFVSHHTLNAICETSMGISLETMGESQEQYRQAIHDMGTILLYRTWRPWFRSDMLFALSPMGKLHTKSLDILHKFTNKVITERKQYHERTNGQYLKFQTNEADSDEVIGTRKKRLAMLDLLIASAHENQLSDADIREEIDTFMFEGHDTVAMGIIFSLLLLAEHKDVQDRVREEVDEVMENNGGKLTMTALQNLPYLERCLKESLRLYPSVPFISRVVSQDVKLQSYTIPAGTVLHINIFDTHRDPKFWEDPEKFDPDRFLTENVRNRHPYSYVPFSAGPRNCIGQRFAMLELKAVIASLVHKFHLEPIDKLSDLEFKIDIILRVSHPIRLKFIPVDKSRKSAKSQSARS
ncbi:cytochrome P450 4C1-like [Pseudomyrmex gracilis]|uniref:cytochrome P450 4C1-like n=1 Tax=Pseudomyrmex gracilis TaxID=219809 RepID=UPI0009950303|nr:cytochrome P450 4C1-like [Pseudomyrmex gracilis]XP_020295586.1 cytochrome P450 4C1-like [Pseudomyrmex gracilis]XP_020295587.1 cytochrome P450 4C1-like [Pseudomyrmex gracilis]XP_020295588.1 cytochrome P450 4C1-like [Pseudomyrmex gracilis]